MKKSAPARIINTTCAAYKLGEIDFDDINFERREYTHAKGYSQSKVAVAMFTKTFARKFPVEGIFMKIFCIKMTFQFLLKEFLAHLSLRLTR